MNDSERKEHMDNWMKEIKDGYKYMATLDTCGRRCGLCGNPSKLQRCGRCFRVFYCSKDCQRLDWARHRQLCKQVTGRTKGPSTQPQEDKPHAEGSAGDAKTEEEQASAGAKDTCKACKQSGQSMKSCSRCSLVAYCSKECQRDDWKRHKKECKKEEKSKVQADWEAGKMFQDFTRSMHPLLQVTSRMSGKPALTWKQAQQEAVGLHPDKTLLTRLQDVTEEEDLDPVLMTSSIFLARLLKPHPYVFRHGWYLEDVKGQQVRIFFYLDHDIPEPYFRWEQLDISNYLCLEHAYIHTFMDGTKGIRVDDACDVSILGC